MTRERKVTEGLRKLAAGDDLGWYTTLLIDTGAQSATEPEAVARTIRMGAAGLLDATTVARALVRIEGVDTERVVRLLDRMAAAGHSRREVWQAMYWCGEPGAARLERAVLEEPDPDGAAGLLAELDLDRAVQAIRLRIVVDDRPVHAADARPLQHLTDTDVAVLAGRYEEDPACLSKAQILGWTEHHLARDLLLADRHLYHPDHRIRQVALHGLRAYCGRRAEPEIDKLIIGLITDDPAPEVRLLARETMETRSMIFPWARELLATVTSPMDLADAASTTPGELPIDTLVSWLTTTGPRQRWALTLVETMPSMLAGDTGAAVRRAIDTLAERTLRGELGAEMVFSLCAILGPGFVDRCVTAMKNDTTGKLHVLAVSLSRAVPNDEDVFEALAIHAGRHPRPLGTGALTTYQLDPVRRAHHLLARLETMTQSAPESVRVWSTALRELQSQQLAQATHQLRERMAAAGNYVLALLPSTASAV